MVTPTPATLDWLLEPSNPSVRYFTLRRLMGRPADDPEVVAARQALMTDGPVPAILSQQDPSGGWGPPTRFYLDKYRGTVWQLIILAELGADGQHPQIRRACDFILTHSQDPASGGFAVSPSGSQPGGRPSEVIPCLTGNLVWSLLQLGQAADPRVQRGLDWICRYQRADDGILDPPTGWPYDRYEMCWGRHSCHMGVVKALKALAAVPPAERSPAVQTKIASLAEYLLIHHVHKRSHDLTQVSKPGWLRFGFPLMYPTDILEILLILTDLGYHDPRLTESLTKLAAKAGPNQRWKLENTVNGKLLVDLETKGQDSKWITLRALQVLSTWS